MKRTIRIAAASVMVAAGLIGAVAAPASAERPLFLFAVHCDTESGPFNALRILPAGEAQSVAIQLKNDASCIPGTVTVLSVEKV